MRLKLWGKNFLLTYIVFLLLLNICLLTLYLSSFQNSYLDFAEDCKEEADQILLLEEQIETGNLGAQEIALIADAYENQQTYIRLWLGDTLLTDRISPRVGSDDYRLDLRYEDYRLQYQRSKEAVYGEAKAMAFRLIFMDLALSMIVGVLIYLGMKKIYKPVSNIAHELRTPLTSILGYAQLLSLDFASEADKRIATRRIETEAKYMRDVVENLLTLDSLSGYRVKMERLEFSLIVDEFREKYSSVEFVNELDVVVGEGTLLRILLTNLLENAVREDMEAKLTADKYRIEISNKTKSLTADDIKLLNEGKRLADGKIKGYGIGMELCREITDAHGWRLVYGLKSGVFKATVYLV